MNPKAVALSILSLNRKWPAVIILLLALLGCSRGTPPVESYEYAAQGLYSGVISTNAEQAIVGSINHGGSLWQIAENARLFNWNHKQDEYSHIIAADFSPNQRLAITATPQTMVLWDTLSGEGISFWTAPSEILDIDLLANTNYALLGMADHSAAIFDVQRGGVKQVYYHKGRVNSVDVNTSKGLVLSGSEDYSARLWQLQTAEELFRWDHEDEVQLVELSPDGNLAFTMSKYDKAAVWNTATGEQVGTIPLFRTALARGKLFTAAVFSEDGTQLATGNSDRLVQLWDIGSMRETGRWILPKRDPMRPTSASVLAVAFTGSNSIFAIASDGFAHKLQIEASSTELLNE